MRLIIKQHFTNLKGFGATARKWPLLFSPGILLILLGIGVFLAPRLVLALLAAFFLAIGALLLFGAWRVVQLVKRANAMAEELKSKVVIQGFQYEDPDETEVFVQDDRKTYYH